MAKQSPKPAAEKASRAAVKLGWRGEARGIASARATYGLILVMSLLAIWTSEDHPHGKEVLVSIAATSIVFWLAHVYSEVIALRIREGRDLHASERRQVALHELPLLEVAIPSMLMIVLSMCGVLSVIKAIDISLWASLIGLGALGGFSAYSAGTRSWRLVFATATSLALGVVIVLLKISID
jgi:hypothetical protein